ncbi:BTB/POZ domain-containing protein 17-like [Patiria miniata]|uniref:BTB domain-containing protein n=1 Tax=Patiria miniata TaxID=46514 RepID=A0A914APR7_PATMI|nr:BTB/POZ domain-containing protein 17-like [Patiria miniata]
MRALLLSQRHWLDLDEDTAAEILEPMQFLQYLHYKHLRNSRLEEDDDSSEDTDQEDDFNPATHLCQQLASYFNNSKFSDITLKVRGNTFRAHKLVLCTWSDAFQEMFVGSKRRTTSEGSITDEGASGEFQFEECTLAESVECSKVFGDFLKFMYTETVELNDNNVYPVFQLAKKYKVQGLCDVCQEFLVEEVSYDKKAALKTLSKAEECGMTKLYKHCFSVLETNFEFLEQSCILDMSPSLFLKLLRSPNLVVSFELLALLLAFKWLTVKGKEERRRYTEEVISLIRFPHISPVSFKTISGKLLSCPKMYPSFKHLLQERIHRVYEWKLLASEGEFRQLPYHMRFAAFARNCVAMRYYISEPEENYKRLTLLDEKVRSRQGKSNEVTKTGLGVPSVWVIGVTANNVHQVEESDWLVDGVAFYDKTCERWGICYHIKPSAAAHARHEHRDYRLVILTILPGSNCRRPKVHTSEGIVPPVGSSQTITVKLPPRLMGLKEKPAHVPVKVSLFIKVKRSQMLNVRLFTPTELLQQKKFTPQIFGW